MRRLIRLWGTQAAADLCLSPVHHLLDGNHVLHDFAFGLLQHLVIATPDSKTGASHATPRPGCPSLDSLPRIFEKNIAMPKEPRTQNQMLSETHTAVLLSRELGDALGQTPDLLTRVWNVLNCVGEGPRLQLPLPLLRRLKELLKCLCGVLQHAA